MVLDSFFRYLQFEKRYSPHTLNAYQTDLRQFTAFVQKTYECEDISLAQSDWVRSWVYELMQSGLKTRSVHRKISSLNSFYLFLIERKLLDINPMSKVVLPRKGKPLPAYFQEDVLRRLVEILPEVENYSTARDKAIILLLSGCGLRRSEVIGLVLEDLDLMKQQLSVRGKGNKVRIVPLQEDVLFALEHVIAERANVKPKKETNLIFLTDKGNPLYPKFVYNLVRKYLAGVTTAEKRGPHTLRHSLATSLLDRGADLNAIKDLLGHEGLSATEVYTHTSVQRLKDAYRKAHPRASKE